MPIYRAKRGVINTKCCVKFNFLNTEGGEKKDELIDGLTSAAYRPTSPRKEFVTREKFEANYKKVSRKAKVSSERTFHRAGITREERKPVNNDFSGGVDVPEKRTAYAFTNFFEDTKDTPLLLRARIYPRLPLFHSNQPVLFGSTSLGRSAVLR